MKCIFTITLSLLLGRDVVGQECFKNCPERIGLSRDSVLNLLKKGPALNKNKQDSLFRLSFRVNNKIFNNLKGCRFPNIYLKTISGDSIRIDEFKGKPVLVHFWFTTCSPCVAEIPELNKLNDEFKDAVIFLSINTDDINTLNKFLIQKTFSTRHALISRDAAAEEFCIISGYPTNIILDDNGIVSDIWAGGYEDPNKQEEFYNRVKNGLTSLLKTTK